jgi:hypothetical protein
VPKPDLGFGVSESGLNPLEPVCVCSLFTRRWKPVLRSEEFPVTEEDEEKHPSIIKNGAKPLDLNVGALIN